MSYPLIFLALAGAKPDYYLDYSRLKYPVGPVTYAVKVTYSSPSPKPGTILGTFTLTMGARVTILPDHRVKISERESPKKFLEGNSGMHLIVDGSTGAGTTSELTYLPDGLLVNSTGGPPPYFKFPKGKLRIGATWPGHFRTKDKDYPVQFKLAGFANIRGKPCAQVVCTTAYQVSGPRGNATYNYRFTAWTTLDKIRPIKQVMEMTFSYGDRVQKVVTESTRVTNPDSP